MILAGLNQTDFISLFTENGCEIVSSKYWELEGVERIVLAKDGQTFVIKLKKYFLYPEVIKKYRMWEFTKVPAACKDDFEACEKAYAQDIAQHERMEAAKKAKNQQPAEEKEEGNDSINS